MFERCALDEIAEVRFLWPFCFSHSFTSQRNACSCCSVSSYRLFTSHSAPLTTGAALLEDSSREKGKILERPGHSREIQRCVESRESTCTNLRLHACI